MKHKSFSVSDIALGNLRHRKSQYILLAVGITLAIYFAAASLLMGYGLYTSIVERRENQYGEYDVALYGLDEAMWDDAAADDTISRMGKVEILALAVFGDAEQSTFPLANFDQEAIALTHRRLKEGAFPKEAGEIALSQAALARLRIDAGIGETVTLTMRIPDGVDYLSDTVEKAYTLVGILYDQAVALKYSSFTSDRTDYAAGMVSPAEEIEPGGRSVVAAFGALFTQNTDTFQYWSDFCDAHDIDMKWNMYEYSLESDDYEMIFTAGGVIIVGIVLVLACCLGIVNSFSANLDARRRQIGLMRAVGATKGQIKRIFRRETLIIALSAAPVGIGLAVASVYGAFAILGNEYHFTPDVWVLLGVAAAGIGCIALASGIPLRRAAAVSPMQVVRDVDMIRAVKNRSVRGKTQFDVARLVASRANRIYKTRKISIGIMLAAGILLFSVSILMINKIVVEVLADYSDSEYRLYSNAIAWDDVLVYGIHAPGLTEGDRQDIVSLPLVESVMGTKEMPIKIIPDTITPYATADGWHLDYRYLATEPLVKPDTGELIEEMDGMIYQMGKAVYTHTVQERIEERNKSYQMWKAEYGYTADYLNTQCVAVEEDFIERLAPYVYEGRINIDKLRSGEEVLLIAPQRYEMYYTPHKSGGYSLSMSKYERPGERVVSSQTNDMFRAGDTIDMSLLYTDGELQYDDGNNILPDVMRIDATVKIGALIDLPAEAYPLGSDTYADFLDVITTLPGLSALGYDVPYLTLSVTLSETPDPETEAYIQDTLEEIESRIPETRLYSELESARENRQFAFQFILAALALIILMMAITASMMNNTLSAHIRAGRRGIGTLRAVGVSDRAIFRSYLYQLLYLFIWGGGVGYVLSIGLTVIMGKIQYLEIKNVPIPYWQPFLFIALLFGICLLNVRARLRGVLRESVIDNIRVL